MLSRDDILAANDLPSEEVDVPEWDGAVLVRAFNARERDSFEASLYSGRGGDIASNMENIRARLVSLTVVDSEGVRLFSDSDAAALGEKSAKAMDRVFAVAQRLNGISSGDVEDLAGN